MDTLEKLNVLAEGAKYDVSCVSSGSSRKNTPGGLGEGYSAGICHSFTTDGRCISLLKILMSNDCVYNCAYCVNRVSNDFPRATFTPEEIVDITINFYRRNYIEGLFLSSAIYKNPNYTMELLLRTLKILREEYRFNGYIHVKAIPGADYRLIEQAGLLADRMSVNIELPTSEGLKLLAPQKKKESILGPMGFISSKIMENNEDTGKYRNTQYFVPAGQSTQLIVGATPDPDINILKLSEALYRRYRLKRVFYSAYVPVSNHPALPAIEKPPLLREHRLYQADWLLRFYGFSADELLSANQPNFNEYLDPKCDWALRNLHLFPVEINRCNYETLLRIPGIGVKSAKRILTARRVSSLDFEDLKKLGVVLKRAQYFITCKGKYYKRIEMNDTFIRQNLMQESMTESLKLGYPVEEYKQLSFLPLDYENRIHRPDYGNRTLQAERIKAITGEL
ncbi:MAG: putative DNA modification/repair radical SAM protein [Firmicutes bacterium]|nr:putative DNA modification/repair radical SAM protein [Bacillota bacterium]